MADKFRLRRKADGFITEPVTEAEAEKIAGYPGDFERVKEREPSRAGYDLPAADGSDTPGSKRQASAAKAAETPAPKTAETKTKS